MISRASQGNERGFTLIEMLVVLTVIGLLAAIAMSNLSTRPAFVDRAQLRTVLQAALTQARQRALQSGEAIPIEMTAVDGKNISLVSLLPADASRPMAYPDGSTSGGVLSLRGKPVYRFDWMTGRIEDASARSADMANLQKSAEGE